MADYHPLIARAVAGLENNTGENRRTLYERARTALVAQLRGITPALNESDITRERLALEDAIRKIESEASRRARGEMPDEGGERSGDADTSSPSSSQRAPAKPPGAPGSSLSDQGLKGFRDVVAEAEGLGGAAANATKAARDVFGAVPEDERRDPSMRREPSFGSEPPPFTPRPNAPPSNPPPSAPDDRGASGLDHDRDVQRDIERDLPRDPSRGQAFDAPHDESYDDAPRPHDDDPSPDEFARSHEPPETLPDPTHDTMPETRRPPVQMRYDGADDDYVRPRRSYGGLIKALIVLLLIGGVAAAGYWQRDRIGSMVTSMRSTTTAPAQRPASTERPKITDRVGANDSSRSANAPAADVAQKVVLYDEDPNDPKGKRYVGSAVWRTETVSPGPGLAPELGIRADIDIPERRMRMTWSLRRNTDKALPASHTIEILFTLPSDFSEGGVANIPGVLMKQSEETRGVPLAGLAVKVTNGYFLIGLSSVDSDVQRNIELLKDRSWFDIPVVYNNGKRAILAVEKGTPGSRVFEEAFRAWGQ
jgi:hypothetical protein